MWLTDTCIVPEKMSPLVHNCRDDYNWMDDDTKDYSPGWKTLNQTNMTDPSRWQALNQTNMTDPSRWKALYQTNMTDPSR